MGIEPCAARRAMGLVSGYRCKSERFGRQLSMSGAVGASRGGATSGLKWGLAQGDPRRIGVAGTTR
jgi:hypothetical protein